MPVPPRISPSAIGGGTVPPLGGGEVPFGCGSIALKNPPDLGEVAALKILAPDPEEQSTHVAPHPVGTFFVGVELEEELPVRGARGERFDPGLVRLVGWAAAVDAVGDGDSSSDSAVWSYRPTQRLPVDREVDPFTIQDIIVYNPPHVSPRIVAQSSCFTVHPPGKELKSFGTLIQTIVRADARKDLKKQLASLGITHACLFPGLDGLAVHANWGSSTVH